MYFGLKRAVIRSILKLQKISIFFHLKIISMGVCFTTFCSQINCFLMRLKNAQLRLLSTPQVERFWQILSTWGVESERDWAFLKIFQKRLIWEQKLVKQTPIEIIFWWKNIIDIFCSFKIEQVAAILSSKYKWPPRPQFLS